MTKFSCTLLGKEYTLSEQKVQALFAEGCSLAEIKAYTQYDAFAQAAKAGYHNQLWELEWHRFIDQSNGFGLAVVAINKLIRRIS